jgi:hypothetical protein
MHAAGASSGAGTADHPTDGRALTGDGEVATWIERGGVGRLSLSPHRDTASIVAS